MYAIRSYYEVKHIDLPAEMQRAMARQAEAEREKRAKIIHASGELEASRQLTEAAELMARVPQTIRITSYNVCYTKLLRGVTPVGLMCARRSSPPPPNTWRWPASGWPPPSSRSPPEPGVAIEALGQARA